jgi:predicted enzyme related to lactoylglutathione lyase
MSKPRFRTLMINAVDASRAIKFWSEFMQAPIAEATEDNRFTWLKTAEGESANIAIQQSDSPLSPNASMHPDILVENLDDAEARILELGGTIIQRNTLPSGFEWRIATDTEGNHFCIFCE